MRRDNTEIYDEGETVLADGATSADVIDHAAAGYKLGGSQMARNFHVIPTVDSAGDATTIEVKLQVDTEAAFGDSPRVIATTGPIAAASFVVGAHFEIPIQRDGARYSRALVAVVGTDETDAKAEIFLGS